MTTAADEKDCPFCAETIKRAAILCRFCGRELPEPAVTDAAPTTPITGSTAPTAPVGEHRPRRRLATAAIAAAAIGLVGIAAVVVTAGGSVPLAGQLVLADPDELDQYDEGEVCSGSDGFSDVRVGAPATVSDESGTVLGTTELSVGKMDGGFCTFTFDFGEVDQADFYQLSVASDRRGTQRFSNDEVDGDLVLTLGSGGPATPLEPCPTTSDLTASKPLQYGREEFEGTSFHLYQSRVTNNTDVPVRVTLLIDAAYANGGEENNRSGVRATVPPGQSLLIPAEQPGLGPDALAAGAPEAFGSPSNVVAVITEVEPLEACK